MARSVIPPLAVLAAIAVLASQGDDPVTYIQRAFRAYRHRDRFRTDYGYYQHFVHGRNRWFPDDTLRQALNNEFEWYWNEARRAPSQQHMIVLLDARRPDGILHQIMGAHRIRMLAQRFLNGLRYLADRRSRLRRRIMDSDAEMDAILGRLLT